MGVKHKVTATKKKENEKKSVKPTAYTSRTRATMRYLEKFYVLRTRLPLEYEQVLKDAARERGISLNQMIVDLIEREFITPANAEKGK